MLSSKHIERLAMMMKSPVWYWIAVRVFTAIERPEEESERAVTPMARPVMAIPSRLTTSGFVIATQSLIKAALIDCSLSRFSMHGANPVPDAYLKRATNYLVLR